jgi:FkbM family methyltransferase
MKTLWKGFAWFNQLPLWRRQITVWDRKMTAISFDRMLNLCLHRIGLMDKNLRRTMQGLVKPGMRVVDVGANQGLFTLLLSDLVGPSGTVISFEPDPELFAVLEHNCRTNQAANVTLRQAAAGARPGALKLHRSLVNAGDNRLAPGLETGSFRLEEVAVVRLDTVLEDQRIDFVKIDVQGWEWEVVQGMEKTLERNPDIRICFEFWPYGLKRAGCDPATLIEFFLRRQFRLSEMSGTNLSDIGDGAALCERLRGTSYTDLYAARLAG